MRLVLLCGLALAAASCRTSPPRDPYAGVPPSPGPGPSWASPPGQSPGLSQELLPPASGEGAPQDERFTGTITRISFGCAVDASCNLVVDGARHVHFGHDTRGKPPSQWGDAESLWPLMREPEQGVGRRVEVFGATTDHESYTIEGKREYYVRVLDR